METTILSSGYVCSTSYSSFKSDREKKLLASLCNFGIREISSKEFTQPAEEQQQVLAILSNQICRGFPTFCSLYVEQELIRVFGQYLEIQEEKNESEFRFSLSDCHKELLLKALCVIEPRWQNLTRPMQDFSSSEQARWLYHEFPDYMRQLVLPEREFQNGLIAGDERNFFRQRVDFALETYSGCRWILEVDGKQHQELSQAEKDRLRDDALRNADWQLKRIKTSEIQNYPAVLSEFWQSVSQDEFLKITKENYTIPLWESDVGLAALHVALAPFAIARLQNVIVRLLQEGAISLRQSAWNVAVFEQDVACTALAFDDFFQLLRNLYVLLGQKESFPKVNLFVLNTKEFNHPVKWQIRSKNVHVSTIGEIGGKADRKYEIVLDISMLRRFGFEQLNEVQRALCPEGTCVLIRSGYSLTPKRIVATAPPITYAILPGEQEASLTYFLQHLFRKKRFREGQVSIIRRALSRKNTIGLLPTGAGKSLCYQLVTLLQPCMTLVIEPLRSLMIDQDTNLKKIGMDCSAFISSDLDAKEKEYVVKRMQRGEFQIVFVSPERLQTKEFRLNIRVLASEKPIGYAVIDEAHCISEWGHDFRTSYLTLARTIREFCQFQGKPPPFYALTGTASISVLTDVCAELEIDKKEREDAIITPTTFDRLELNFLIYQVSSAQKFGTLQKVFEEIQAKFDIDEDILFTPNGENTYSGLLFCPHVNNTDFAVTTLKSKIGNLFGFQNDRIHIFAGKTPNGFTESSWNKYKLQAQKEFIENKVPLMISTKSFGMGIDKPNIRYTIHYHLPGSIESFYQEAGRAGRDGCDAFCALIFSDDSGNKGDLHRMLFFQKKSFQGRQVEKENIMKLLKGKIGLKLGAMREKSTGDVIIKGYEDTEKVLYRLLVLGVIENYTIEFQRPRVFNVHLRRKPYKEYAKQLHDYLKLHKTELEQDFERFYKYVQRRPEKHPVKKYCDELLDFVYDIIERQRRQALAYMADTARSKDVETFRERILRYLSPDEELNSLFKIFPRSTFLEEWDVILQKSQESTSTHNKLFGICQRNSNSYPQSVGLHFLSSALRLTLPRESQQSGIEDFIAAVNRMKEVKSIYSDAEAERIARYFTDCILRKSVHEYKRARQEIARRFLTEFRSESNAKWLYESDFDLPVRKIGATVLLETLSNRTTALIREIKES